MSQSDQLSLADSIGYLAEQLDRLSTEEAHALAGEPEQIPAEALNRLVAATARLYAIRDAETTDSPLLDDRTGTTEAVVLACALIKAHDLNPFDLALWFSRG